LQYAKSHLELIVKDLGKYVNDFKAKLVIIDGIVSLHRAEFAGRGTLADRQQRLNSMLHKIIRYRIYLRKSGENRLAKIVDSPYHPYSDTRLTINERGADDIEEEVSSKRNRKGSKTTDD
jgi:DNA repair protein RadA